MDSEILKIRPYLDNLAPSVNLSCVGKVGKTFEPIQPKQYTPGTLEPVPTDDIITLTPRIEIVGTYNPTGRGYIYVQHKAGNKTNLKKGGRKKLCRLNLTPHAKRMIISAGDALEALKEAGTIKTTVMVTLSYRKNVPDHKTAKKHLANWIRAMKIKGYCKYFAWVAQNQNGKRAEGTGRTSYRAMHGDAIHFHIITSRVSIEDARHAWRIIVKNWEHENGLKSEPISGVHIQQVYNASRYISRYITLEEKAGTIKGNMWNISAPLRKLCKFEKSASVTITLAEWKQYIHAHRINSKNHEVTQRKYVEKVHCVKDWKGLPVVFFRNVPNALKDVYRYKHHIRKLEKLLKYAKITTLQRRTMDVKTLTIASD